MTARRLFSSFILMTIFTSFLPIGAADIANSASNLQWKNVTTDTFQGHNYTLVTDPVLKWAEAEESCRLENLILTKIETLELLQFHLGLITKAGGRLAWIGATNLNRDEFVWIENEKPFPSFLWMLGEPNNLGGVEYFLHLDRSGVNDNSEEKTFPFMCKTRDPVEITTTETTTTTTTETTTTTTEKTTTTTEMTTEKTTTTTEKVGFCTSPGFSPDPDDCQKYHLCELNEVGDSWELVLTCPDSSVWCQDEVKCQSAEICPCSLFE